MLLGEFEFLTTTDPFVRSDAKAEMLACCILVTAMAMVGTLVLVNLLLALIVSDVESLYKIR